MRSSKRKLTDFLSSSSPTSLTSETRRRRGNGRNTSTSALNHTTMSKLEETDTKTEQTSTKGIGDMSEALTIGHSSNALSMESKNIKTEPNDIKVDSRYQQPKLSAEEDEVVMRKYYPAEMSNDRVEMYKSGELPKPIDQLQEALSSTSEGRSKINVKDAVVHWFRGDLRIKDNAALHMASELAQSKGVSLIAIFLVSPQDYEAHIKSPARVDFILRTLDVLKDDLDKLNIPLWVEVVEDRKDTGHKIIQLMEKWNASHILGNMEYEVDELRRDARIVKMALKKGINFTVVHDSIIVPPGILVTKSTQQPFTVFSPWFKAWVAYLHENPKHLDLFSSPKPNPSTTRTRYKELFGCPIPSCPEGKQLNPEEIDYIRSTWPPGEKEALHRLRMFLDEKITAYKDNRDFPGGNGTSILSVHFAAGTLSSRTAVNKARKLLGNGTLNSGNKGITCWISEVGWREFYRMILIHFPWVCMSKPFKVEYSNIPWAYNDAHFEAWCTGRTGYPIVDAAMRQLVTMKYMHNRTRMITASFLAKDLCLDWRKGERFFMEHLIDGDFASNNGGWGWSSSSGCDPQPYFRIFNPLLQSMKFDPDGDYIRKWVPELGHVKGDAIHAPFERLDRKEWAKVEAMGYPKPLVKHFEAKDKALDMYKKGLGRDKP